MKTIFSFLFVVLAFFAFSCDHATGGEESPSSATASVSEESDTDRSTPKEGNSYLYTYTLTTEGEYAMESDVKMYVSEPGMRSEMKMNIMGREMALVTMALKSHPERSIIINEDDRSYAIREAEDLK